VVSLVGLENTLWGTPRKIGWGCAARFPKPLPHLLSISAIFLPYLWHDPKFDILVMTVAAGTAAINIIYEGLLLMVLSIMMKK